MSQLSAETVAAAEDVRAETISSSQETPGKDHLTAIPVAREFFGTHG